MNATVRAAGEVPQQEGVDVAEEYFASFGQRLYSWNVLQYPTYLEPAKVGRKRQAGLSTEAVLTAALRQLVHVAADAGVLPHDSVVYRLAGFAVPHHGGLALIGDADGFQVLCCQPL